MRTVYQRARKIDILVDSISSIISTPVPTRERQSAAPMRYRRDSICSRAVVVFRRITRHAGYVPGRVCLS